MNTLTIKLDDDNARLVAEAVRAANQPLAHWLRELAFLDGTVNFGS